MKCVREVVQFLMVTVRLLTPMTLYHPWCIQAAKGTNIDPGKHFPNLEDVKTNGSGSKEVKVTSNLAGIHFVLCAKFPRKSWI